MGESHYEVLGVSPRAEDVVIEGAYKALLKRYHPDVHAGDTVTATARTARINEAYRVLKDPVARALYDRDRAAGAAKPPPRNDPPRQERQTPPPSPARNWSPPAAAPPPVPPASGPAKAVATAFMGLAVLVIVAGVGSFRTASNKAAPTPVAAVEPAPATARKPRRVSPPVKTAPLVETYKTSFDCRKADTPVLTAICTNAELAKADRDMAARYKELLATVDPPDELRAAQRAWLGRRDAAVAEPKTLLELYHDRLLELGSDQAIVDQLY